MRCSVEGCERAAVARGLCKAHHQKARRAAKRAERGAIEIKPLAQVHMGAYAGPEVKEIHIRLTEDEHRKLLRLCDETGLSASALMRAWIRGAK